MKGWTSARGPGSGLEWIPGFLCLPPPPVPAMPGCRALVLSLSHSLSFSFSLSLSFTLIIFGLLTSPLQIVPFFHISLLVFISSFTTHLTNIYHISTDYIPSITPTMFYLSRSLSLSFYHSNPLFDALPLLISIYFLILLCILFSLQIYKTLCNQIISENLAGIRTKQADYRYTIPSLINDVAYTDLLPHPSNSVTCH